MTIHLGRAPSREGWVSFETDPHLTVTKERLQHRCLPCLTGLLDQLKAGHQRVALGFAWECWKVVALTRDREECLAFLERFGEEHPEEYCYGKLGHGGPHRKSWAVIFHTETERRRDEIFTLARALADRMDSTRPVFYSRGCGDPYERLFGPWQGWGRNCPIRHPERVEEVKASLVESLYRR